MADSQLRLNEDTEVDDVITFVEDRVGNPAVLGDVTVYNFHNASLKAQAIAEWAHEAEPGVYVIPYQIPAVWAFMAILLPQEIAEARPLVYRKSDDEYDDYANFLAEVDPYEEDHIREWLRERVAEDAG